MNNNNVIGLIGFIGFGNYGTALAHIVSKNNNVIIYSRNEDVVEYFLKHKKNKNYLCDIKFNDNVKVTNCLNDVINNIDILILAIPAQAVQQFLIQNKDMIADSLVIVNTSKGLSIIEKSNISQCISKICPNNIICSIQGPSFAKEIVKELPTELIVASNSETNAAKVVKILTTNFTKISISTDIIGCEYSSSLKNVYAIGAGLLSGFGYENNSLASYITNAFNEQNELIKAVGGKNDINAATLGDLILTCYSNLSRNKTFGEKYAKGEVVDMQASTIEGLATIEVAVEIADKNKLKTPILRGIQKILKKDIKSITQSDKLMLMSINL